MIHNSSNDPVLIKKISLKIWSLRDEIESRIEEQLAATPEGEINVENIRNEYIKSAGPVTNNVLPIKSAEELDTGEDEMARAMRGEDVEIENAEATEGSNDNNNVVALDNQNSNVINISVVPPKISDEKKSIGKTVLSEINMDKMFFFCNKPFTEGQSIVVQFCIPKMFLMNADILYCRPFNLKSRIISQNNYNYRVLVKFTYLKEGERALLRQFIQSIEPDLSKLDKKSDTPTEGNGESFGELDDLGL